MERIVNNYELSISELYSATHYLVDTNIEVVFKEQLTTTGEPSIHRYLSKEMKASRIINGSDKGLIVFYNSKNLIYFFEGIALLPRVYALVYYEPPLKKD